MINDLSILQTMSAKAAHASRRHAVLSENIANADTPGYKAKDVIPFAELYETAAKTATDISNVVSSSALIKQGGAADPNGNTVSLEDQMLSTAMVVGEHDLAMLIYRKTMDMMKLTVSKNI